jgi:cytoskeletal protein CcmA (bactofilin family)
MTNPTALQKSLNLRGLENSNPAERSAESRPNPMAEYTTNSKNILAADVEIKGSIKFQNDLTVDGKVEGEITSTGTLTVGENAEIRGEIKTKSTTVHGKVHGNITVEERCELKARAVLHGDLKAARLVIEEGATFVGKSEVTPNKVTTMKPEVVRSPEPKAAAAVGNR